MSIKDKKAIEKAWTLTTSVKQIHTERVCGSVAIHLYQYPITHLFLPRSGTHALQQLTGTLHTQPEISLTWSWPKGSSSGRGRVSYSPHSPSVKRAVLPFCSPGKTQELSCPPSSPGNTTNFKFHNHGAVSASVGTLEAFFIWEVPTATQMIKSK